MIVCNIKDVDLKLETAESLFSPGGIDRGTLAMLSCVEFKSGDKVMDLGCGYGAVGILAAKLVGADNVVMSDIDGKAVAIARRNAELNGVAGIPSYVSDGFTNVPDAGFTIILSNPPYHEDFSVAKAFIEKGFNRLVIGGRMYMVTKREMWYRNKLTAIFGGVRVMTVDGYFVFMAEKRAVTYAKKGAKAKR